MPPSNCPTASTVPLEELLAVVKAARALRDKLGEIEPELTNAFSFLSAHGFHWLGPTYATERDNLNTALSNLDKVNP